MWPLIIVLFLKGHKQFVLEGVTYFFDNLDETCRKEDKEDRWDIAHVALFSGSFISHVQVFVGVFLCSLPFLLFSTDWSV